MAHARVKSSIEPSALRGSEDVAQPGHRVVAALRNVASGPRPGDVQLVVRVVGDHQEVTRGAVAGVGHRLLRVE